MKIDPKKETIEHYTRQTPLNESTLRFKPLRLKLITTIFFIGFVVLLVRAGLIILIPPSSEGLEGLANRQYNRSINLAAYRGTIFDRRGEPMAISIRKHSLFVNPKVFNPSYDQKKYLAHHLNLSTREISKISQKNSHFSWLKRKINDDQYKEIAKLKIDGIHTVQEPYRYYPSGLASQLIGYVGTDNKGLLGLELSFDKLLRGDQETNIMKRDARGRIIHNESRSAAPQKPGHKVYLSLDRVVQEISERALEKGVKNAKAKSGFAIVSDPHTGHILAMANYPKFDPNQSKSINSKNTRNYALLDLFEPGSVVKPFVIAKALELKKTSLVEAFDIHKGYFREGSLRIRDSHPSETLSTEEILVESSNIGTYKIAQRIGPKALSDSFRSFGISEQMLRVSDHQQSVGRIDNWRSWKKVRFANISFGQGLLTSAIEIVQAYGAIANGGQLMKPILVEKVEDYGQEVVEASHPVAIRRVIPEDVARKISRSLAKVVEEGTGGNASSSLYTVAGKTGTSEKADPETKRYSKHLRLASFAGFSPVSDPHLVIYVVIDEPGNKPYYGGTWAAPVFKEINEQSLRYLNVAPDKELELSQKTIP